MVLKKIEFFVFLLYPFHILISRMTYFLKTLNLFYLLEIYKIIYFLEICSWWSHSNFLFQNGSKFVLFEKVLRNTFPNSIKQYVRKGCTFRIIFFHTIERNRIYEFPLCLYFLSFMYFLFQYLRWLYKEKSIWIKAVISSSNYVDHHSVGNHLREKWVERFRFSRR